MTLLAPAAGAAPTPPSRRTTVAAAVLGAVCHLSFALGVGLMIWTMFRGMTGAHGRLAAPWGVLADALLLAQFAFAHSFLLTRRGSRVLKRLAPGPKASQLQTTTYAAIASLQVLALFALWTPSGVVWWRASGAVFWGLTALYAGSWMFLLKAIVDAGFASQVGLLGWFAVARGREPVYPPMPVKGLFRWVRQPIYLGFAMTTWTVPVWTPDQLAVAVALTGYCVLGPLLKEARFRRRFGPAFQAYQAKTPYWLPWPGRGGRA